MTAELSAGLVAWARLAGPVAVLREVRSRAERGYDTERGRLRLDLTGEQRREVARLLGTPWEISGRAVRLQDLATALAEHGLTVRQLVERVDGRPLVDLKQVRADERSAALAVAEAERVSAAELLSRVGLRADAVQAWLSDSGLPKPGTGELRHLAEQVAAVWPRLPGHGRAMPLAELAAALPDHNAHALDYGELLGRAVVRLIAAEYGLPRPQRANRDWRRAWECVGVRCDGVSPRVLTLNLPLQGDCPAARWSAAAPGEPLWLTLRTTSGGWTVPTGTTVFVCENVTVLESAADRLGARCPALVATDGIATNAALDLIAGLDSAGCAFRIRADFDTAGFVVVDQVRTVAAAAACWRYDARTYATHLRLPDVPTPLGTTDADLRQLRELYAKIGTDIHEEALLHLLMADLEEAALR